MYPPITLYKDGALMFCEDASEFDGNYDPPEAPEQEVKVAIAVIKDVDPLDKFIDKMRILYDQIVEPMINQNYSYESSEQAIEMCEKLSSDATNIFNTLRIKLTKLAGITFGGITERMAKESFMGHAGTFMKNAALIRQQGVEEYGISWKELPAFSNSWCLENLIDSICTKDIVLDRILYENDLVTLIGNNDNMNVLRNFNGFIDLMQCLFRDNERLERLSVECGTKLTFRDMMADTNGQIDTRDNYGIKACQMMMVKLFNLMSCSLRHLCQTSYELQVGLVDNTVTQEVYEARLKPLINRTVNLFGLGVALGCHYATCLRRAIAVQKGCEEYTKLLLDTIKNHGGQA